VTLVVLSLLVLFFQLWLVFVPPKTVSVSSPEALPVGVLLHTGTDRFKIAGFDNREDHPDITVTSVATGVSYKIAFCDRLATPGRVVDLPVETWGAHAPNRSVTVRIGAKACDVPLADRSGG
jgi:hypothetical protein